MEQTTQSTCSFLEDVSTAINNVNMTDILPYTNTCIISCPHSYCVETSVSGLKLSDWMVLTAEGQCPECRNQ
jgi:hypothetical protein